MRWAGHVASMGGEERHIQVGKPEGKRPLGRPRCRWKDINMDLQEVDWIELGRDRGRWRALMNLWVP